MLAGRLANLEAKVDRIDAKIDTRFDLLSGWIEQVSTQLSGRLDQLSGHIDQTNSKIDARFDTLSGKIDRVVWVVVVGLLITILVNLAI